MTFTFTRAGVIAQARLHHVLEAMSCLFAGEAATDSVWHGDAQEGSYRFDNGEGDAFAFRWDATGLVGLAFAHESERSAFNEDPALREPLRHLAGLPTSLWPLARATAVELGNLVTSGLWADRETVTLSEPDARLASHEAHGLEQLAGFACTPEEAVLGTALRQNWQVLSGVSRPQALLALRLARMAGPTLLSAEEEDVLCSDPRPRHPGKPIRIEAAQRASTRLRQLGIAWPPPVARIEAARLARDHAHRAVIDAAMGPRNRELLEAARTNDVGALEASLAAGADIDTQTIEEHWECTPAGDSALIVACKARAIDAARLLLERGANVAAENRFGQNAQFWAERSGNEALAAACRAGQRSQARDDTRQR